MKEALRNHMVKVYHGDGSPLHSRKVRPNDPCPCGSGKKAKHCCGTDYGYYTTQPKKKEPLTREEEQIVNGKLNDTNPGRRKRRHPERQEVLLEK